MAGELGQLRLPQLLCVPGSLDKLHMIACCAKWPLHGLKQWMDNYLVEVCVSKDLTIFPCGVFEGSSCWFAEFKKNVLKLGVFQACLKGSFEKSLSVLNYTQQKGS